MSDSHSNHLIWTTYTVFKP